MGRLIKEENITVLVGTRPNGTEATFAIYEKKRCASGYDGGFIPLSITNTFGSITGGNTFIESSGFGVAGTVTGSARLKETVEELRTLFEQANESIPDICQPSRFEKAAEFVRCHFVPKFLIN